jgi:hypothetical protein
MLNYATLRFKVSLFGQFSSLLLLDFQQEVANDSIDICSPFVVTLYVLWQVTANEFL